METRPLRILSYNIHGRAHRFDRRYLDRIARVIEEARPDAVGLQEVYRGSRHSRFEDQAGAIAARIGMNAWFGPSFEIEGGHFGNAVLTTGEVRASEVVPLPGAGEPRTLLHSRIVFPAEEIDFYVTHLAAWGRWSRAARSVQISGLLERLKQSNGPFVLVGDLNAPPEAPEIGTLLAAEMFWVCGDEMACTHRFMRQRIDYVFADPGWTTRSSTVLRTGPSDHWPVLVELERTAQS
jgi:endonuclease/exonuclease/phosphatase family metal-dependent hydrolase